jgi:signal transduction histidine kinase
MQAKVNQHKEEAVLQPSPRAQGAMPLKAEATRASSRRFARTAIVSGVALLICVLGLAIALLTSLSSASRSFELASRAQSQSAIVSAIEATALRAARAHGAESGLNTRLTDQLRAQLADYQRSVAEEGDALSRLGVSSGAFEEESRTVESLSALALRAAAGDTSDLDGLRAAVATIVRLEAAEGAAVDQDMAALRSRMIGFGVALAFGSVALAVLAGGNLISVNRRLEDQVRAQTAALEIRNQRLAEIDDRRRLFFSKLSHELRTPVTVMRGEAEVALQLGGDGAAAREALGQVVVHAEVLNRRLDELLDLARAADGRLTLDRKAFDLGDLLKRVRAEAGPFARSSEVVLSFPAPQRPVRVIGDERWLGQALMTVIDNAVKFSGAGEVVTVTLVGDGDRVSIGIADRGPGIDEADLPHVFEPYYQASSGRARGGIGLGLALARWVVEQQDGSISVTNGPERGCRVAIDLPVAS